MALLTPEELTAFVSGLREESDELVGLLVDGAEALAAAHLGWVFPDGQHGPTLERSTYVEVRDPSDVVDLQMLHLGGPASPGAVTAVYDDEGRFDGNERPLDIVQRGCELWLPSGRLGSTWVQLTYDAGFTAVTLPVGVRMALLLTARALWVRRLFDLPNGVPDDGSSVLDADIRTLLHRYRAQGVANA